MPTSDYTPSLAEVGSRIRRRTINNYGQTTGTFSDGGSDPRLLTKPTATEANLLIADAVLEVASAVGVDLPDGPDDQPDIYRSQARKLAALYAAMNIELEYYGEEVASTHGSTYSQLKDLWDAGRKRLMESINEAKGGSGTGGESIGSDATPVAHYDGFPTGTDWDHKRF